MPSLESSLVELDADQVTVQNATNYATLWSQYLPLTQANAVFYVLLAPLFFTRFSITLLTSTHIKLLFNPEVYPVQIPSTAQNPPERPVAYTSDATYASQSDARYARPLRLLTILGPALYAYFTRKKIAYITTETHESIDSDEYLVTSDDDALRPYILFR